METEKQNLGEIYAAHALNGSEPSASTISIPKIRESRDMVYSGTKNSIINSGIAVNNEKSRNNKKNNLRQISPFTIILLLLGGAVASVLYIGNILAVGRLMTQNNQFQIKHLQLLSEQELLKAEINRLSSLERIQQLANNQLGLRNPKQLPVWIEIDPERIRQVEEIIQQQSEYR